MEKFVFFVGYPRSGHSILGSFIDAHPHGAISHEFTLFKRWKCFSNRKRKSGTDNPYFKNQTLLFSALYWHSFQSTNSINGARSGSRSPKNYTLNVEYPWQGRYDTYLSVIGDKSGGKTTSVYLESHEAFSRYLSELKQTVEVPIKAIHAVRNPFDLISTNLLYDNHRYLPLLDGLELENTLDVDATHVASYKSAMNRLRAQENDTAFKKAKYDAKFHLIGSVNKLLNSASAVKGIINLIGRNNVFEVHNMDLVNEPKATMKKICSFLEIECPPDYLQACANKVFKSVSKTRSLLVWHPELRLRVQKKLIKRYPFFNRYTFESE